jgi:hypothetical protein
MKRTLAYFLIALTANLAERGFKNCEQQRMWLRDSTTRTSKHCYSNDCSSG